MSKDKKIVIALLSCIALSGAVTAVEITKAVEAGLSIELTLDEAEAISKEVQAARDAAIEEICGVLEENGDIRVEEGELRR